jgi:hypothetical protein
VDPSAATARRDEFEVRNTAGNLGSQGPADRSRRVVRCSVSTTGGSQRETLEGSTGIQIGLDRPLYDFWLSCNIM